MGEVSSSTRRISGELSRLKASHLGIAGCAGGLFVRYLDDGERQLRWVDAELAAAAELATAASEVEDPDMKLALLRLAGPRLEAAMLGSTLLTVWVAWSQSRWRPQRTTCPPWWATSPASSPHSSRPRTRGRKSLRRRWC
ncbi:hypothetical protein ACN28E_08870 [Archangium lansingense]|uniref:hypothetical protein n=1 Tax=Archangium lansingense TaxID=2995310 RepID=UPI003B816E76